METLICSDSAVLPLHVAVWDTAGPDPAITQQFRASLCQGCQHSCAAQT